MVVLFHSEYSNIGRKLEQYINDSHPYKEDFCPDQPQPN